MVKQQQAFIGSKQVARIAAISAIVAAGWFGAVAPAAADSTLRVFRSQMPDGSVVLGDRPAAGARSVDSSNYTVTSPRQGAGGAEAEREYWRQQAEAFANRQARRETMQGRRGHGGGYHGAMRGDADYSVWVPGAHAGRPLVSLNRIDPVYRSSPGAVRGRDSGFIGSGFSTAR